MGWRSSRAGGYCGPGAGPANLQYRLDFCRGHGSSSGTGGISDTHRPCGFPSFRRAGRNEGASLLYPFGQERPRLRHLPSAGIRHEFFCGSRARSVEADKRQGPAVRGDRRVQLPESSAGTGKIALPAAAARAHSGFSSRSEECRVHDQCGERSHGMQHQSGLWTEQSDPYRIRLSTATHGCEPQVRDEPGTTNRLEAGRAIGYGSSDRQAGGHEFHGGRARSHADHAGTKCIVGARGSAIRDRRSTAEDRRIRKSGVRGADL